MVEFFEIGEIVNIPKYKIIGKVYDKVILFGKFNLHVEIDKDKTYNTYKEIPSRIYYNIEPMCVKSLKPMRMYNKNNKVLKLYNTITINNVKKKLKVKFIDNYYIEEWVNNKNIDIRFIYSKFFMSYLLKAKEIRVKNPKKYSFNYDNLIFVTCTVISENGDKNDIVIDLRGLQKVESKSIIDILKINTSFVNKFFKFISN